MKSRLKLVIGLAFIASALIITTGCSRTDDGVTLIRIDFFDMGQALRQGTIDAFLSGEPFPSMAYLEGFGRILSYPYFDDRIGTINAAMITTRERIENNREMVQDLVNAHVRSTRHLNADREAWIAQALEFGTERSVLEFSMNNIELVYSIDQDFIERTRVLAHEMYALGMITHIPDVEALFDLSFLDAFS